MFLHVQSGSSCFLFQFLLLELIFTEVFLAVDEGHAQVLLDLLRDASGIKAHGEVAPVVFTLLEFLPVSLASLLLATMAYQVQQGDGGYEHPIVVARHNKNHR